MEVGYARVSSTGQNLDVQLEKLKHCEKIFQEKVSALDAKRSELEKCLDFVREGDSLVISKLDRLARSTLDLCQIAKTLEQKGVALKVLDQAIDTTSSAGRLMFNVLGSIAQFENEIRAERQREGIEKAKRKGIRFGRKKLLNTSQISDLRQKREQGITISQLMQEFKVSKSSLYLYLSVAIDILPHLKEGEDVK